MKKVTFVSVFIMVFALFSLTSCDNEPLEGEFGSNDDSNSSPVNCVHATQNLTEALSIYNSVTPSDPNYTTACNAYATALQNFVSACGDASGTFQAILDSLDCSADTPDDCPSAQTATQAAATAYNANNTSSSLCNAYINALQNEITLCGDANGDLQAIIDGLDCGSNNSNTDFWPRAIGNSWTYNTAQFGQQTYQITSLETIDGQEYYVFEDLFGFPSWLRKSGVNYLLRAEAEGSVPGYQFSSTPFTVNMIKEDATINETWESNVTYTISYVAEPGFPDAPDTTVSATYTFEMIERDISRTVEGVSFDDVIHIEARVNGQGQSSVVQYYYANNVGMIDYITDPGSNTLLNYNLN